MCSFFTQHNATDAASFEVACNWHAQGQGLDSGEDDALDWQRVPIPTNIQQLHTAIEQVETAVTSGWQVEWSHDL